jgi:hypothetical protein
MHFNNRERSILHKHNEIGIILSFLSGTVLSAEELKMLLKDEITAGKLKFKPIADTLPYNTSKNSSN